MASDKNCIKHILVIAVLFVAFITGNINNWFICLLVCSVFFSHKFPITVESCPKEKPYARPV